MSRFAARVIATAALVAGFTFAASGQTGTIRGTVKDPQGQPIAGAVVSVISSPGSAPVAPVAAPATAPSFAPPPPGQPVQTGLPGFLPLRANAPSGADGSFEIDNVPAASYYLCASGADSDLLDPCWWSDAPTTVTAPAAGVSLVVAHGVTIGLRVQDAQGLTGARPAIDDILVGTVHGSSSFIPARVLQRDRTGKTLGLTVPPGIALSVSVQSANFAMTDATGAPLAAGAGIPVTAPLVAAPTGPTGLPVPSVTVQVGGVAAAPKAAAASSQAGPGPSNSNSKRRQVK